MPLANLRYKMIHGQGNEILFAKPVIASPVIQQKMEEPQAVVLPLLGLIGVA